MKWLTRSLTRFRKAARPVLPGWRSSLEILEDRTVPATASSIVANFNPTAIPAGDTVWFDGAFKVSGLGSATTVNVNVTNQAITFTAAGTNYSVDLPDSNINLAKTTTVATTSYDAVNDAWNTNLPLSFGGNAFLGGGDMPVSVSLPGGIKNVTWSGTFSTDTAGITVSWQWGAAVYTSFGSDYNALNVKPLDGNPTVYNNGDHAGTPEASKSFCTAGATGGGGNNWTGNLTPGTNVKPSVNSGGALLYPFPSSNPLTSVVFNESDVLAAAKLDLTNGAFEVWYSDEHALSLGVRQVNVTTATGTTTTNYPIATMAANPNGAVNPATGTTATTGDQAGIDPSGRPIAPSLYITDITSNPNSLSGDWQYGGTAIAPSAVFGAWKGAVRTVNYTTSPATVTVTCDADPAKNGWNLGAGADAPPAGLANAGYGAEMRWSLNDLSNQGLLIPGHTYRFYVMVHDGDQNKSGGDAGQAAYNYLYPVPPASQVAGLSGFVYADDGLGNLSALAGVTLTLTGTTTSGQQVNFTVLTLADGSYSFPNLQPGTYTITQTLPPGYSFKSDSVGTVNGLSDGSAGTSKLQGITLNPGDLGINYDFTDIMILS
jgi:hypothetical protein